MWVWRHLQRRHEGERAKLACAVDQHGALRSQGFDEATVVQRGDAKTLHAVIPGGIVDPALPRRWGVQDQCAPVKGENRRTSHTGSQASGTDNILRWIPHTLGIILRVRGEVKAQR